MLMPLVMICSPCFFLILFAISSVVVPESRMIVSPSLDQRRSHRADVRCFSSACAFSLS